MSIPSPSPSPAPDTPGRRGAAWEPLLVRLMVVAAAFVAIVAALLAWNYSQRLLKDPLNTEDFKALKAQLAELKQQEPSDEVQRQIEATVEQIRQADLALRQEYFRERRFTARGAWLLLAGLAVLAAAAKAVTVLRRRLPMPEPQSGPQDIDSRMARIGRWSVAAVGLALAAGAIALSRNTETVFGDAAAPSTVATADPGDVPKPNVSHPARPMPVGDSPSKEEIAKNWPRFRGPGGRGISLFDNLPTKWDVASGDGIAWKTPIPLPGNSSPIVWNDRVFLTGGTVEKHEVYCLSTADGKLLWQKEVPITPAGKGKMEIMEDTGHASPTPVTDGRRVYASFANGDFAALDLAGALVWSRGFGVPKNSYGHATSLEMAAGLLVVQMDQGSAKEGKSKLLGLDPATGNSVWETKREVPASWCTPLAVEVNGQPQIVTGGDPWAIAYSPADGKEIWRAKCLRQDVGPSPAFADGIVYLANQYPQATAIRPDGQGDVTASHVLWSGEDGLPDTSSPLATPEYLLLLTSSGTLTCYEAKKGKKLWEQDYESTFKSSPGLAGKRVYLFGDDEGKVWVVEPGPTGAKTIAENNMGEKCTASPAFQDGRIYVRTKTQLYAIGKK